MKVIYVAGPYTGKTINETFENIIKARQAAQRLWLRGFAVICPHMNSAFMDGETVDQTRQMFVDGDLEILKRCDVIFMLKGWEKSAGATAELKYAQELGLEIIFEGKEDVEST